MLTRLRVKGFKNLADVEVRFGPFTCVAGGNGVGKSNLFDAIRFLGALGEYEFSEAARSIRDDGEFRGDFKDLFHRNGEAVDERMSFEADLIIGPTGHDDFRNPAAASATFLRYSVDLRRYEKGEDGAPARIELVKEELVSLKQDEIRRTCGFQHSKAWLESVRGGKGGKNFISTEIVDGRATIKRHQDGPPGRMQEMQAADTPRTILSRLNANEAPTALLVRRELASWQFLQLEPSALRRPSPIGRTTAGQRLGANGDHLAGTLYRLVRDAQKSGDTGTNVTLRLTNRLADLIGETYAVEVERDDRLDLYALTATDRRGTKYPAKALSEGTLRFLALAVLEEDRASPGIICYEEPENGIHPERISAMMELLRDLATDPEEPVGPDNPFRQVIVNTHSPLAVREVAPADMLYAITYSSPRRGASVDYTFPASTWRAAGAPALHLTPPGVLSVYLGRQNRLRAEEQWRKAVPSLFEGVR